MKYKSIFLLTTLIAIGLLTGCNDKKEAAKEENVYYTCPMHPQVHEHEPGKCPVCGMDLVKKEDKH